MNIMGLGCIGISVVLVTIGTLSLLIRSRVSDSHMDCPECHDGQQSFPCETCDGAGSINQGYNPVPTRNGGTSNSFLQGLIQRGGRWGGFK